MFGLGSEAPRIPDAQPYQPPPPQPYNGSQIGSAFALRNAMRTVPRMSPGMLGSYGGINQQFGSVNPDIQRQRLINSSTRQPIGTLGSVSNPLTMDTPGAITKGFAEPTDTGVRPGRFTGMNAVEAARAAQAQRQNVPPPAREPGMGGSVVNGYMRG